MIGFEEYESEPNALVLIEASRAEGYLAEPVLKIEIKRLENEDREVLIF